MNTSGSTREPEEHGTLRRGLFARRDLSPAEPMMTPTEFRLAETLQQAVDERLEDHLHAIEEQATALMREVASEVWRSSARDVRPEQERIVTLLSRDQAIKSLIISSDERFQSLAVRAARLEDHLQDLAESDRRTREAMEISAKAIREIAESPTLHGVDTVRTQLEMVEHHIAEAFAHFDQRDEAIATTILDQVRDHGELIANETGRIVEAMESYVQGGAEAVGRLAQRVEEHAQQFVLQDHNLTESVREVMDLQTTELTEQLAFVREKVGLHGREQEQMRAQIEHLVDARVRGLAELIRSDSTALRGLIEERAAVTVEGGVAFDEEGMIRAIDERMGALESIVAERMSSLERTLGEQVLTLSTATSASVERNMERMVTAAGSIEGIDEMVAESQQAFEERMMGHVDDRMTAVARLIRSDNQVLAEKMSSMQVAPAAASVGVPAQAGIDADLIRGLIRTIKELEAGMGSEFVGTVDRRVQTLSDQLHKETQLQAESMIKVAEVLGAKIDRLSVHVDEGVGNDLQVVVDRMSDAIRAMSTMRRDIA